MRRRFPLRGIPASCLKVSRTKAAIFSVGAIVFFPWAGASAQDSVPAVVFRFDRAPLAIHLDPAFGEGGLFGRRFPTNMIVDRRFQQILEALAESNAERWRARVLAALTAPADLPTVEPEPPAAVEPVIDPLPQARVDLNVELNARIETRVDQLRNLNCSATDISNAAAGCQGGFPTPALAPRFDLRAGGVLAERLHVNVDFDPDREFSANNTINFWYQGREDEIVRRIEVGNLDFRLPTSRFITSAIPANSFGVQADAQVGPLDFRAILAQQKGTSVRSRVFLIGDQTTQTVAREVRDLDFETGRFFFAANPADIPGYPDIDILDVEPETVPPDLRPVDVRIYRLRAQSGQVESSPNLGGIDAVALRDDSPQRVGPFPWELLIEGTDYYLDRSRLWFALTNRVGNEEYLAVSFITAAGDTIGTFPSTNSIADTLRLIHEPRRGTDAPTFSYEMRNIYRVGGVDISRSTIQMTLLVNESERPLDGVGTYLSRLDLARSTDQSVLDEFNRVFPRERDPNGGEPIRDLFLVFPHLEPFADSVSLDMGERNDSLYRTPTHLLRSEGPPVRFNLEWVYEATGSGDRSQVNLGAIQVQQGSEIVLLGDRELVRGRDYEIEYDLGTIRFNDPDTLFTGPTQVTVQFEENTLFDIRPRNVFGLATTYNVATHGRIDAIGLFQRERTALTRPQLGFEPQAMFMGGLSGEFQFRADWLTRALDAVPIMATNVPSTLDIRGELAVSRPNANEAGQAYIEEFESQSGLTVQMHETSFQLGSRPSSGHGVPASHLGLGGEFDAADAVPMVWQNAVEANGGRLEIGARQIDSSIVLTGASQQVETLLWLTLKPDTVGGAPDAVTGAPRWRRAPQPSPRWRSITQPLDRSGLGVDLSRTEFLEFWMAEDFALTARRQNAMVVVDFGTVFEDALAFGPDEFRVIGSDTVFSGFQFLGQGVLDSEKDPVTNVFNAVVHDIGIHGDRLPSIRNTDTGNLVTDVSVCEQGFSVGIPVFPLGSLNARCTRRNGSADTEDLDGDNRLDLTVGTAQEDVLRHTFFVGDDRFVARTGLTIEDVNGRSYTWRLYRIPFRADTAQIGSPNLRQVRSMRVTVVTPDNGAAEEEFSVAIARMRLVGAPWLKRAETPISGLSGQVGEPHGEIVASVISTENVDLGYTSPPDIVNQADQRGASLQPFTQQINEKSLRLLATDLRADERAESFIRFSGASDRNFLKFRTVRVWARGRGPGWLEEDLLFFLKVGRDEHNFYLYRTPVHTEDWLPEIIVDLERWVALRSRVEAAWLAGQPPTGSAECGGDVEAYVACDGPYMVHVRDPGVAPPNLARVSEVAVGMYRQNETVVIPQAELWVDDIRLGEFVDDLGVAHSLEARLTAADFAEFTFTRSGVDDRFRQLDDIPDYQGDVVTRIGSTVRLDKLLPSSLGFSVPFSYQRQTSDTDPFFVRRSDVLADSLSDLRRPESNFTSYQLTLRRSRRGATLPERLIVDPLVVTASRVKASETTELTTASTENQRLRVDYNNRPIPQTIPGAPGFLVNLVDDLPGWIRDSEFGRALRTSRLRLNPFRIRVLSTLTDNATRRLTFRVPVELPEDSARTPLRSIVHTWRNEVSVDLRPFSSLGLRVDYSTTRDLQNYGDSTSVGRLLDNERRSFLGKDVGFERDRMLQTSFTVSPVLNGWWRPSVTISSDFLFRRDPNGRAAVDALPGGAEAFRVPESISNRRWRELASTVDLSRLVSGTIGNGHPVARLVSGLLPADVRFRRELRSTFDRVPFEPDLRYQLGFGDIDQFRVQEGILSTSAVEHDEWTAAGGTQLPLGLRVRLNYRETETTTWSRRGETQTPIVQETREWPSGFLTWVYTPNWALGDVMSTVTAQAQYRKTEATSFQPSQSEMSQVPAGVFAQTDLTSITPSVTFTWVSGIVTTGNLRKIRSDLITSGNLTRNDETGWGGTLSFAVRAPQWLVRLPSEVRAAVAVSSNDQLVCLLRASSDDCVPVSDSRRRQMDVRLNTAFPPSMRGGASFSYILTDQRHTSSRFSQLVLTVFLEINFLDSRIR